MKILVTGANGYLGQGIVKQLLDDGCNVIAVDFKTNYVDKRATCINCDLFNIDDPYKFFGEPEIILHLAWRNGFKHFDDSHIEDLPKHFEFLKLISNSKISQIVVMGTMHEIGFYEGCIKEDTPCSPSNNYGIAKNALRQLTKNLCKNNDKVFQWLRGFYIVGNSTFGDSIFSKITSSVNEGKNIFPFTMGKNLYDFLNYEDFCIQVASAVEQKEITGIINICSGQPISLGNRVESFIKDNGYNIKLDYGAFPDRPYDSKAVWGDNEKIMAIIKAKKNNSGSNI